MTRWSKWVPIAAAATLLLYWLSWLYMGTRSWPELSVTAFILLTFVLGCLWLQWRLTREDERASISQTKSPEPTAQDTQPRTGAEIAKQPADKWWRYVAVLLILLTATSMVWLIVRSQSTVPIQLLQEKDRQLQDAEKFLEACHRELANKTAPGTATVNLPPEIQDGLLLLLKHPPNADDWPAWGTVWIIIVALIVVGVIAWKHSESIPISAAVAMSKWLIDHAEHFPKMKGWTFGLVIVAFTLIAAALSFPFFTAVRRWAKGSANAFGPPAIDKEGKDVLKDLLSINFSLAIVVWSIVIVVLMAYCSDCTGSVDTGPKAPVTKAEFHEDMLHPGTFSRKGEATPADSERVAGITTAVTDLKAKQGDVLLLLGSADCLRYHPGSQSGSRSNKDLAQDRARNLRDALQKQFGEKKVDVQVLADALPQYRGCKETPELRGVYPLLIRNVGK